MDGVKKNRKILIILLIIVFIIFISLFVFLMFDNKFYVKEFDDVVQLNVGEEFVENFGFVCYGNEFICKDVVVSKDGEIDTKILGEYDITYTYKYGEKTFQKIQTVKVVDEEKPSLEVEDKELLYCPNGKIPDYKVVSIDNYDGDISGNVLKEIEDGMMIFKVKDSSGNETVVSKEAYAKDEIKPTLTLKGDKIVYVKLNDKYNEPGYEASDNCDGNITNKVSISGYVDTKTPGEYTLTYKALDESNNAVTAQRKIFVYKDVNYETPTGKSIYLTFDDGPSIYTSKLLDVLKKYNVKATFFVTGNGKAYENMILREYQEGHTVGLHSDTHNYKIYANKDTYFNDLYTIQEKVKSITGYTSTIIRFPGGSSNTVSRSYDGGAHIMSYLTKKVEQEGFRYFDWNVDSGDAGGAKTSSQVANNVIRSLGNGSTYVVLQHDIKGFSVDAVETIIKYGLSHGYTFRAIDMNTPTVHHNINN